MYCVKMGCHLRYIDLKNKPFLGLNINSCIVHFLPSDRSSLSVWQLPEMGFNLHTMFISNQIIVII